MEKPISNVHATLHNPIFIILYIGDKGELVRKVKTIFGQRHAIYSWVLFVSYK